MKTMMDHKWVVGFILTGNEIMYDEGAILKYGLLITPSQQSENPFTFSAEQSFQRENTEKRSYLFYSQGQFNPFLIQTAHGNNL